MSKSLNREEFLFKILERVDETGCSPVYAISEMIKEETKKTDFVVNARGSSFISFEANSLDYAIKQFLGVRYPANENTIIGNSVHAGADYAYKFFLETKKYPKRRHCIRKVIDKVKKDYQFINPDSRDKHSVRELAVEGVRLFKKYWNIILLNVPVESEKGLFLEVPEEMLQNPQNKGRIRFTGTLDRVYKGINGHLILSDLKTSKKRISAGVEYSKELALLVEEEKALLDDLKKIEKEIADLEKIKDKQQKANEEKNQVHAELSTMVFSNIELLESDLKAKESEEKPNQKTINKINEQITEMQGYIVDFKLINMLNLLGGDFQEKVQSPKRLIAKLEKLVGLIDDEEVIQFETVNLRKIRLTAQLDEVALEIEPLKKVWLAEVKKAEIEAAKAQYGVQLAFYAMVYMILEGKKIDRLRVEILVKNKKEPFVQIIEWDLDESATC